MRCPPRPTTRVHRAPGSLNELTTLLLGTVAATAGQPVLVGGAIALAVVPYVASKVRDRRNRVTSSPVGYLLAADRSLTGPRLLQALKS
jgi:hypothetical protein